MFDYIFGPVLSSRLGNSLGIDLLGKNICSFDCLYCESGKTEIKTVQRAPYVSLEKIMDELGEWFAGGSNPDYITLGGPGEPCLNSRLGEIISAVKDFRPGIPLAVLTNSSLLSNTDVSEELLKADVLLPSLDSMVEKEFIRINRPHPDIRLENMVQGLLGFKSRFTGRIFLEVLLVPGLNDSTENFELLKDFQARLRPDRVDITAMSRPGAYMDLPGPGARSLDKWRREFKTSSRPLSVPGRKTEMSESQLRERIEASIKRRPQTPQQLGAALGADASAAASLLGRMHEAGEVEVTAENEKGQKFYIKRG
jgi:wyosine [tRNA(Phe)-imidazoG37] synthetase (radical SAM superfamily)